MMKATGNKRQDKETGREEEDAKRDKGRRGPYTTR